MKLFAASAFPFAFGHWSMTFPPPRYGVSMTDFGEGALWFNEGSQIGCNQSAATTDVLCGNAAHGAYPSRNCCNTLMEPTLTNSSLLSYASSFLLNGTKIDNRPSLKHNP